MCHLDTQNSLQPLHTELARYFFMDEKILELANFMVHTDQASLTLKPKFQRFR